MVLGQVPAQPRQTRRFVDAHESAARCILRHELVDPQELRMDRVLTDTGDVRIALRARQAMVTGRIERRKVARTARLSGALLRT